MNNDSENDLATKLKNFEQTAQAIKTENKIKNKLTKFHDLFIGIGWQSTIAALVNSITVNKLCKTR